MYTVSVPLEIVFSPKRKFRLNLNIYRNTHYQTLNNAKVKFKEVVKQSIEPLPVMNKVRLTLTLFLQSNRSADLSNICCIVDKFFCDALVEYGKLPDDKVGIINDIHYTFGGVDKTNPRVEITIQPE